MAIYHLSVSIIGRNAGRSSVAAAAYRAGENLVNEYDGIEHDFTKKNWVEYTEIILPENAPEDYKDRSTLWNAVEMAEKTKDAQLAREFEIALPIEMSREEQLEILHDFVNKNMVDKGMCVDIAIHNPPLMNDRHQPVDKYGKVTKNMEEMIHINPHAHIMATVRPMDENGVWEKKSQVEYVCRREDEEKAFTASEFKEAKNEGWEKVYKYKLNNKPIWLTASKAEEQGLSHARMSKHPKTTSFGRKNETVENWNSKERVPEWRESWEQIVNDKFASMGSDTRIDSRSFEKQGREDEIPTIHMGAAATMMEKRANREISEGKLESQVIRSDIGEMNRQIKEHNSFVRELKKAFTSMVKKAKDFISETAKILESKRSELIGNSYETTMLSREYNRMDLSLLNEEEKIKKYNRLVEEIKVANNESKTRIEQLKDELRKCKHLQISKKMELKRKIKEEQADMEYRSDYLSSVHTTCGFSSNQEVNNVIKAHQKKKVIHQELGNTIQSLKDNSKRLVNEYKEVISELTEKDKKEISLIRNDNRLEFERTSKEIMAKKHGISFSEEIYEVEKYKTDALLEIIENSSEKKVISRSIVKL